VFRWRNLRFRVIDLLIYVSHFYGSSFRFSYSKEDCLIKVWNITLESKQLLRESLAWRWEMYVNSYLFDIFVADRITLILLK